MTQKYDASSSVVRRLPRYYRLLGELERNGQVRTSSRELGKMCIRDRSMGEGLNAASTAMHAAKMSGKADRFCFDDQMVENALRQKEVSQMFPKALADREFVVYYQPKVTLADNQLCGCEALVRWFRDGAMAVSYTHLDVYNRQGLQYASAERNSMEPSRPGAYSSCTSGMRFSSDQLMREGAAR